MKELSIEDKELLLKDLCARLPYGTIIQVKDWATLDSELRCGHILRLQRDEIELKPYLRPMPSMTEEEKAELMDKCLLYIDVIDWLLEHHFDIRGLIPMDLALAAPDGMYDKKD